MSETKLLTSERVIEVVDLRRIEKCHLVKQIRTLESGKALSITPPLTSKERAALTSRCRFAGFKIKTRQTIESSFVWFHCDAPPPPSIKARRPTAGTQ